VSGAALLSVALCVAVSGLALAQEGPEGEEETGQVSLRGSVIGYLQMGDHARAWSDHHEEQGQSEESAAAFARAVHVHASPEKRSAWMGTLSPLLPWVPPFCVLAARDALDRDQRSDAVTAAQWGLRGTLPGSATAEVLHALLAEAQDSAPVHMDRLGVLLPLSGPFKALGQGVLAALKLALEKEEQVHLVVRDTAGSAESARALARELIHDHGVGGVLGPVGKRESAAASAVLKDAGVPHAPLSRQEAGEGAGECVVTARLTRDAEVLALVQVASAERSASRFAIVREDSLHGAAMAGALRAAARRAGGAVTRELILPPTGGNQPLAAWDGLDELAAAATQEDLHALFLPVPVRLAHRLLPHLRARGVRFSEEGGPGLLLLGSSQWDVADVLDPAEATTLGAWYPTGFSPRPGDGGPSEFQRAFQGLHGVAPGSEDAETYDISRMLLRALASAREGKSGREGACAALRSGETRSGATGLLRVLDQGRTSRAVVIREVGPKGTRDRATVRVAGGEAVVEERHEGP